MQTCVARCLERGKGSGRTDDNEASLKKRYTNLIQMTKEKVRLFVCLLCRSRIVTYNDSTRPVIQLFEKENLVKHIDASNDVDKVCLLKQSLTRNKNGFICFLIGFSRCSNGIRWLQTQQCIVHHRKIDSTFYNKTFNLIQFKF